MGGQKMGKGMMEMGGMEGMKPEEMMKMMMKMRGAKPSELYPSLMSLPELSPEKRDEVQREAHKRMKAGTALMSQGFERLSKAAGDDYVAMQKGTEQMREGLALFESGLAAHRALREGKSPRDIALQWFMREMNLLPPPSPESQGGVFGLSWFHFFFMVILIGFPAAMIWVYFHKMRRAAALLQSLTGGAPPPQAAEVAASTPPAQPSLSDGTPALSAIPLASAGPAVGAKLTKWTGNLRIRRIFQETPDVKTFRLMNPLGGVLPFSCLPGQFLTVTVLINGKPVKRSYTIASSPTQHDYVEITVKHEGGERSRATCTPSTLVVEEWLFIEYDVATIPVNPEAVVEFVSKTILGAEPVPFITLTELEKSMQKRIEGIDIGAIAQETIARIQGRV
jgi:hypothetical protein